MGKKSSETRDGARTRLTVEFTPQQLEKIEELAQARQQPKTEIVREAMTFFLKRCEFVEKGFEVGAFKTHENAPPTLVSFV